MGVSCLYRPFLPPQPIFLNLFVLGRNYGGLEPLGRLGRPAEVDPYRNDNGHPHHFDGLLVECPPLRRHRRPTSAQGQVSRHFQIMCYGTPLEALSSCHHLSAKYMVSLVWYLGLWFGSLFHMAHIDMI